MTWTTEQIRAARQRPLAPLLTQRGYKLRILPGGSAILTGKHNGVFIRQGQWIWKTASQDGNAIDFFMILEGKTFHQAMNILTGQDEDNAPDKDNKDDPGDPQSDEESEDPALPDWVKQRQIELKLQRDSAP